MREWNDKLQKRKERKVGDTKKNGAIRQILWMMMATVMLATSVPMPGSITAWAAEVEVTSDKIPHGKTGKNLTINFKIRSSRDIDDVHICFDVTGGEIWDETDEDREYGYAFPFEQTGEGLV